MYSFLFFGLYPSIFISSLTAPLELLNEYAFFEKTIVIPSSGITVPVAIAGAIYIATTASGFCAYFVKRVFIDSGLSSGYACNVQPPYTPSYTVPLG